MKIIFKNLKRSELVKEVVLERFSATIARFPDLLSSRPTVILSMQNSPFQAGPDLFSVKFICESGRYRNLVLEKSAPNIYVALADLIEHLLERLSRFGDKERMKQRRSARKASRSIEMTPMREKQSS